VRDRRPGAGPPYEQRHRGDQRGGGYRRTEGFSRVSSTHLAQRFKELIGVTPKRLARTYRFATTVLSINPAEPIDWADLASSAGYFDQAHFGHEFREFTGLTPTRYVEVRRQFLREHPGHVMDGWPLPAD
jgi:Helix-turn-helix domain